MKKYICLLLLALGLLLTGCGKASFDITQFGDNISIKANAQDGKTAETSYFTVGKNEVVTVSSSLTGGKLQIEFVETFISYHSDSPDEVVPVRTVKTITVTPDYSTTVELDSGDYVLWLTAIGQTTGTVTVKVEKQ